MSAKDDEYVCSVCCGLGGRYDDVAVDQWYTCKGCDMAERIRELEADLAQAREQLAAAHDEKCEAVAAVTTTAIREMCGLKDEQICRLTAQLAAASRPEVVSPITAIIQGDLDKTREAFAAFQEDVRAYSKECGAFANARRQNAVSDVWGIVQRRLQRMLAELNGGG